MKLLNQYLDPQDAAEAKSRLREAGIASLVEAMDPHSVQPSKSGATHVGLWVLLDDQLPDAIRVLEDPAHVPAHVLTHREIDKLEGKAENRVAKGRLADKLLVWLLLTGLMSLIIFTVADFFLDI